MGIFSDFMDVAIPTLTDEFFGDPATFSPLTGADIPGVYVVLVHDVALYPETYEAQEPVTETVLDYHFVDLGRVPEQGETFTMDGAATVWTVARLLENNKSVVRVVVHDD